MSFVRVFLIGAIMGMLSCATAFAVEPKNLLLEVTLENPMADTYHLKLKITNTSSEPILIYDTDLPWITPNQLVFVKRAYWTNAPRGVLPKFTPMEDYARIPNQLAPGEFLEDAIDLNTMFPSLNEVTRKYNVTIEWNCRSKRLEFRCKGGKSGSFVIPKKQTRIGGRPPFASPGPSISQSK